MLIGIASNRGSEGFGCYILGHRVRAFLFMEGPMSVAMVIVHGLPKLHCLHPIVCKLLLTPRLKAPIPFFPLQLTVPTIPTLATPTTSEPRTLLCNTRSHKSAYSRQVLSLALGTRHQTVNPTLTPPPNSPLSKRS